MICGPRNSIVAQLQGAVYDWLLDASPWIVATSIWPELHEIWIDKIHDYVHEGD